MWLWYFSFAMPFGCSRDIPQMHHAQFHLLVHFLVSLKWLMAPYSFVQWTPPLRMTNKSASPIMSVWLHIQKVTIYIGGTHITTPLQPWLDRRLMKPAAWFMLENLFSPRNETTHKGRLFFSCHIASGTGQQGALFVCKFTLTALQHWVKWEPVFV